MCPSGQELRDLKRTCRRPSARQGFLGSKVSSEHQWNTEVATTVSREFLTYYPATQQPLPYYLKSKKNWLVKKLTTTIAFIFNNIQSKRKKNYLHLKKELLIHIYDTTYMQTKSFLITIEQLHNQLHNQQDFLMLQICLHSMKYETAYVASNIFINNISLLQQTEFSLNISCNSSHPNTEDAANYV